MQFLKSLSPRRGLDVVRRGLADLRGFLASRSRIERWMILPAFLAAGAVIYAFYLDSRFFRPYKPEIIYVQSWPLNRSDAEIIAQQKIDRVERDKRRADYERRLKASQDEYKQIDNTLKSWGI